MQRILVIGSGNVLDESLFWLLKKEEGLHVSKFAYIDDTSLLNGVSNVKPDVIVLVEDETISVIKILNVLRSTLLPAGLRIVSVHEDDNNLEIYDRTCVTVADSRDLLHVVRRDTISARPEQHAGLLQK